MSSSVSQEVKMLKLMTAIMESNKNLSLCVIIPKILISKGKGK